MGSLLGRLVREGRLGRSRNGKALSIRQLAERLGVHHSYLSRIERGDDVGLRPEKLVKLAELLGLDSHFVLAVAGIVPERLREAIFDNRTAFIAFARNVLHGEQEPGAGDARTGEMYGPNWRIAYADEADLVRCLVSSMSREGWIVSQLAVETLAAALAATPPPFCDVGLKRGVANAGGVRSMRIVRRQLPRQRGGVALVRCSPRVGTGKVRTALNLLRCLHPGFGVRVQVLDGFGIELFDSRSEVGMQEESDDTRRAGGAEGGTDGGFALQERACRVAVTEGHGDPGCDRLTVWVLSVSLFFSWNEMDAFTVFVSAVGDAAQPPGMIAAQPTGKE